MKSIFKILILAAGLMLATTAVVDQGLAADKGSQLIFQSNMANKNFISIANMNNDEDDKKAVTTLVQYYNDEMELILWYLRVIPAGGTILVDPFKHMIPGSDPATDSGDFIMGTEKDNSGHFVIAVTAVGANVSVKDSEVKSGPNTVETVNVLFPAFLVGDLHSTDNIDNCGELQTKNEGKPNNNNLTYTENGTDGADDCDADDITSKNVGDLNVDNAEPIAFDHLTGSFTEALTSTGTGGSDQTASWGGIPVIRESAAEPAATEYQTLDGEVDTGGQLAEKSAGGSEKENIVTPVTTKRQKYQDIGDNEGKIAPNTEINNRGLNADGSLVLPSLYGGATEETHQIIRLLSVADDFGGAGKYTLLPAKTGYRVMLRDNMGDALPDPASDDSPVFGGVKDPDPPPGTKIIVEGIRVMSDASVDKCGKAMIDGPPQWTLAQLVNIVPTAASGASDFDGLDAMLDPAMNNSPGSIEFMRTELTCKEDYGDGDAATGSSVEDPDGVPTSDERTYVAGTLIVEEKNSNRNFVTTGYVVVKYITAKSTFGASWSLQ